MSFKNKIVLLVQDILPKKKQLNDTKCIQVDSRRKMFLVIEKPFSYASSRFESETDFCRKVRAYLNFTVKIKHSDFELSCGKTTHKYFIVDILAVFLIIC